MYTQPQTSFHNCSRTHTNTFFQKKSWNFILNLYLFHRFYGKRNGKWICGHAVHVCTKKRYMHTPARTFSKHFLYPSAQKSLYPHLYTHTSTHAHYWFANQGHHPQTFFWNWWKMQFNHVLANLDRFDPFWTDLIHFGQIWSILDRFDPIWWKKKLSSSYSCYKTLFILLNSNSVQNLFRYYELLTAVASLINVC